VGAAAGLLPTTIAHGKYPQKFLLKNGFLLPIVVCASHVQIASAALSAESSALSAESSTFPSGSRQGPLVSESLMACHQAAWLGIILFCLCRGVSYSLIRVSCNYASTSRLTQSGPVLAVA